MNDQEFTIQEFCVRLQTVRDFAYAHYSGEVRELIKCKAPSQDQAEYLLDGLLDFCGEERFLNLFKDTCRHLLSLYPSMVQEYVQLYHTQYEEPDDICNV